MTSDTLHWDTDLAEGFTGLSSAVLALGADHWESLGATFVVDESDPDWPQRVALGSISTPLDEQRRFAILDEGDVTTLLVGGDDERRAMAGLAVLFALAAGGQIDLDHDVLQVGIGDERATRMAPAVAAVEHLVQEVASLRERIRIQNGGLEDRQRASDHGLASTGVGTLEPRLAAQSRESATRPLLVLAFDGVLCDAFEECMMVAWYAHTGAPADKFVSPGLDALPHGVIDRFWRCRPFMRYLRHLLVPIVSTSLPTSHADFAACYDALPHADVERFGAAVERYRSSVRRKHTDAWYARHYMQDDLRDVAAGAYIATARDIASVSQILRHHGFDVEDDHLFGSLRGKTAALREVAHRESRPSSDVVLVDNSIENCILARDAGFSAYRASWGYHADQDAETAVEHGIPTVSVEDLRLRRVAVVAPE